MTPTQPIAVALEERIAVTFATLALPSELARASVAQRPELGDFQCNAAMALARRLSKAPLDIAEEIAETFNAAASSMAVASVAAPGFVNFRLDDDYLARQLQSVSEHERLGVAQLEGSLPAVIDFGGPNVAKSMHVGHLRSSILGDCLQRLFRYLGLTVISDVHLGDWGTQMGMLIIEAQRRWPDLPYFDESREVGFPPESPVTLDELNAMYPVVAERCRADADELERARAATAELQAGRPGYRALWRHFVDVTVESLSRDFDVLGVHFDLWLGESDVQDRVADVIESLDEDGLVVESDEALVVRLDDEGLPPLVIRKRDGASLYGTTDLATLHFRADVLRSREVLYVVDERQHLHFTQLFSVAAKWKATKEMSLEHIGFGTVNGPDGRPFKTRSGDVVQLRDLLDGAREHAARHMDELELGADLPSDERAELPALVGLGAIRYADLMHNRTSSYQFDLRKFTAFEGNTGPYLQYTAVRIASILRRAQEAGVPRGRLLPPTADERVLYLHAAAFSTVVHSAYERRSPHLLCEYAFELAQTFNRQSPHMHVLREPSPARQQSRVTLIATVHRILTDIAGLLGVPIPPRM